MRKRVKPTHIAAGALAMTFAVVIGANVLPSRSPGSTPPQPLKPTLLEALASQPMSKNQIGQHAGGPYTFARELEAQPQLAAADIKPPRLGGAALSPHRDSQTLRSAPRLASIGPTGGATLRAQQHHDSQPQPGAESNSGANDTPQNSDDENTKPNDETAGLTDENPAGQEQTPDQGDQGEPDQPPTLPVNPLPTQPGSPDGNQPPAAEVPEPSSLALLSLGLLMLGVLRRRTRG